MLVPEHQIKHLIKTVYKDDIRRLRIQEVKCFSQLINFLSTIYKAPSSQSYRFGIKFKDKENDLCSITSDLELLEAITFSHEIGSTLRLFISFDTVAITAPPEPVQMNSKSNSSSTCNNSNNNKSNYSKGNRIDNSQDSSAVPPTEELKARGIDDSEAQLIIAAKRSKQDDFEVQMREDLEKLNREVRESMRKDISQWLADRHHLHQEKTHRETLRLFHNWCVDPGMYGGLSWVGEGNIREDGSLLDRIGKAQEWITIFENVRSNEIKPVVSSVEVKALTVPSREIDIPKHADMLTDSSDAGDAGDSMRYAQEIRVLQEMGFDHPTDLLNVLLQMNQGCVDVVAMNLLEQLSPGIASPYVHVESPM